MSDGSRRLSPRRLEAYSDGVFAIAATLLVLDLSVDHLGSIANNDELWRALGDISRSLLSFVISFLLLCMLWIVHTRQFEHVRQVDTAVLWLNSVRLLGIVLIPFTTSLSADFGDFLIGRLVLPLNFLFVLVLGWMLWRYVSVRSRGLLDDMSDEQVRSSGRRALWAVITGMLVVVLAPFIGPWAFLAFTVSQSVEVHKWRLRRPGRDNAPS